MWHSLHTVTLCAILFVVPPCLPVRSAETNCTFCPVRQSIWRLLKSATMQGNHDSSSRISYQLLILPYFLLKPMGLACFRDHVNQWRIIQHLHDGRHIFVLQLLQVNVHHSWIVLNSGITLLKPSSNYTGIFVNHQFASLGSHTWQLAVLVVN